MSAHNTAASNGKYRSLVHVAPSQNGTKSLSSNTKQRSSGAAGPLCWPLLSFLSYKIWCVHVLSRAFGHTAAVGCTLD